jgi:regulator of protease activity HflC (stomatin/prohibitin superfamily)
VDVHDKLDELITIVEDARSMPMSASCIINRGEVLGLLEEVRALLPEEFRHAQLLLADRESVVDEGRREAARIIDRAEDERLALTAETEVVAEAQRQAARIRQEALDEAGVMRGEVDDYVDTKLANFEVVLDKTLSAVQRGREKLRGRTAHEDLAGAENRPIEPHPFDTESRG